MMIGGLSEGKILRVMGMGSSMQLKNHPAGDAINRRISILVLNKHAEEAIERENSEGEAITISDAGELQRQVQGTRTVPALAPQMSPAPAAPALAPQASPAPAAPENAPSIPGIETQTPVTPSAGAQPATAAPAVAAGTAPATH